ncbi:MAG: tRNA lysidine(34) synthetase TilS, partial [Verrucomicrobia bacterium]|nr:tRNA lysidine(34) synthetase TilS [Verrucomicrobiota bacterium]
MTTLLQKVEETIRSRALLARGDGVLVATSGGVDSMVLLHLLNALALKHEWKLSVAHFDHKLRGSSSSADARLVKLTAHRLGLPFHCKRADVKSHAAKNKVSVEMAARELRHAFLARTARKMGVRCVALAHHADDQVELFFLRVLRGAGSDGMGGMKWQNVSPADARLKLIRPLLAISKTELLAFALSNKISFREDASNASSDILRNRIRHELLPLLRRRFEPALNSAVLRMMEITRDDTAFVEQAATQWLKKNRPGFSKLAVAVQRRILRIQLRSAGVETGFDLVETLRQSPGTPVIIRPGSAMVHDGLGKVSLRKIVSKQFRTQQHSATLKGASGQIAFGEGVINWQRTSLRGNILVTRSKGTEFFDADKIGSRIVLRHWRAGDRFQPIGMEHFVKLQDWFTNRKIPL